MRVILSLIVFLLTAGSLSASTTGKIAGHIIDKENRESLPGAQIMVISRWVDNRAIPLEKVSGAAADFEGYYYIINLEPGLYVLSVQMIGYQKLIIEKVRVSVNTTSTFNFELIPQAIETDAVIVQAEKVMIKKDQTSSVRNVSSDQISILPVEDVNAVVGMQAGVVNGHFRGGRSTEVTYLIDGLQVTEAFERTGKSVDLEKESIQDLEVITGTFNAEYGRAMSGVVNAVTKNGNNNYSGEVSIGAGNYYTSHQNIFIGLKEKDFFRNQDYKFQLDGPLLKNKIFFFGNIRYQDNLNHLNGIHRFNVNDYSNFNSTEPTMWFSEHNGDDSYVPMNASKNLSVMGKLTFRVIENIKISFLYTLNDDEWHNYTHTFKYNPDGRATSYRNTDLYMLQINHTVNKTAFQELKVSFMDTYNGWYVFKNPEDSRYIHDVYFENSGPGFYTGGQEKGHTQRTMKDINIKYDVTWQISNTHGLKTGFLYTGHELDHSWSAIRNQYYGSAQELDFIIDPLTNKISFPNYQAITLPDSTVYSDIYQVKPIEFSVYMQDKMEFEEMVINIGLRYDYFDPNTVYPSQLRNPANQLYFPDSLLGMMSVYPHTKASFQLSPRFGLSYQLGKAAILHFSYGHFFQMPPLYALYQNHSFQVSPTDYETTTGNPALKAEKTVQYEIGLWQEIIPDMGVEVNLFYRDIYDLLSAKVISTYNQIEYGLYSNKDYGNVKGLEIKFDFVWRNIFTNLNYTLQYTRGNADNPTQTFTRAGDSMDPIARLIPMSWDQRHTFNLTVGYTHPLYGITLTGYYNSGSPYSWSPIAESALSRVNLYPNNAWKPGRMSIDMNGYYSFSFIKGKKIQLTFSVYNLLDRLNEEWVNGNTGRAYTAIIRPEDIANHRSNFNVYEDRIMDPSAYSSPRLIKLGLAVVF